jgi:hypothetical protein
MKILVVTYEPFHDNSSVVGAFSSLDAVKKAFPNLQFSTEGYYVSGPVVAQQVIPKGSDELLIVTELELDGEPLNL